MRLHPPPLGHAQRRELEQDVIRDSDLAHVVEQEAVLGALVVDQVGADRLRQLDRVALDALRVRPGAGVLRLQSRREGRDRLVIGVLEQVALAALDFEQVPEIPRVEKKLLLRLTLLGRAKRNPVKTARETLDDRQQLQRAEGLAQEGLGARLEGRLGRPSIRAAQDDDGDLARLSVPFQLPAVAWSCRSLPVLWVMPSLFPRLSVL